MARPKTVLIDRAIVIREAVKLLEKNGLEGFNLRALAKRLSAHPSSIYHYFDGRAAILSAVAGHLLRDVEVPEIGDDWQAWAVETTMVYWESLLSRPFVIPIMLAGFEPATAVRSQLDATMASEGIPSDRRGEIFRAFEACVFGFALVYSATEQPVGASEPIDAIAKTLRSTLTFILHDKLGAT